MPRLKFVVCTAVLIMLIDACACTCTHGKVRIIDALCVIFR